MTKHATVRKDVEQLFVVLGENARDIGEYLMSQGIRGKPRDSRECVIARYLSLVTTSDSRVTSITVLRDAVKVRLSGTAWRSVTIPLPVALRDFVLLFDASYLPDLEEQSDPELMPEAEVPNVA